nr:hypothetical protein [Tanacetum cinerariifolium]
MSKEDQTVVTALPKFDMPSYESKMTAKDVKSLALRHGIPLDLHPVALTEGWTMDKLPDDMIACAVRIEPIDYVRAILSEPKYCPFCKFILRFYKVSKQGGFLLKRESARVLVVKFSESFGRPFLDINDPVPEDGFSMQDVEALTERVIDLRPVPSGLLFQGGLATTWHYPGFHPIFQDTEGNVVTMSEYLRFPFLSDASISKGPALTSQDRVSQHTTCPLLEGQNIPEKTDHQRRVEVEDPKIVATRDRKAKVVAKKMERKKQGGNDGEGSQPKTKQRKTTGRKDGPVASEATSSPEPIRTLNPHQPSGALAATAESRENSSPHASPRDSANRSVHNYSNDHRDEETDDLNLGSSDEKSRRALTLVNTEELKAALAQKDFAFVYAERINAERAQEKERLISRGFHHSVSDLLKVYPDSPPREQVPPHKPLSEKAPLTSAPPGS